MACCAGQESDESPGLANCRDVAAELLHALQSDDIEAFRSLLAEANPEEINKLHTVPQCTSCTTCLQLACLNGHADFVALLIKHGAEVDIYSPTKTNRALHMACFNAHHNCVELLLEAGADVNSRVGSHRKSPLHLIMSTWKELKGSPTIRFPTVPVPTSKESKFAKCFQLLLTHPKVDLEVKDDRGRTPLELAVRNQNGFAKKTLISCGAKVNARVKEAVTQMQKYMTEIDERLYLIDQQDEPPGEPNPGDQIRDVIRRKDHVQLQELLGSLPSPTATYLNYTIQNLNCVQYCILEGSVECLQALLEAGAHPNLYTVYKSRPPIVIAAYHGNAQMLQVLLANRVTEINAFDEPTTRQTALHKVVRSISKVHSKYLECLSILLESNKTISIDSPDVLGNTALHYAVRTGVEEAVLYLLRRGASLISENFWNSRPIWDILPTTLETFLDECIEQSEDEGRASVDYYIRFKYSFLSRQARNSGVNYVDEENASSRECFEDIESSGPIPEPASPSDNVSNSDRRKRGDCYPESEALWYLSIFSRHKHLLRHPVVTSFLLLKWHKIRKYFYINLAFYLITVAMLTTYVLLWKSTDPKTELNFLRSALAILVAINLCVKIVQYVISPMRYALFFDNYLQLGIIANTIIILWYSGESDKYRDYGAMAVICAYTASLLKIGRVPKWSILVQIFTCVTRRFFLFLLWYSTLIFGFAVSFYVLFRELDPSSKNDTSPSDNCTTSPTDIDDATK